MEHEGAGVTQVMQTSNMNVLMEKTRNMTLSQLEALYSGRFHEGEIREMKQEFDNIAKASAERAGSEIAPPPDCIDSKMLQNLLIRGSSLPTPPDTVTMQKALTVFAASRFQGPDALVLDAPGSAGPGSSRNLSAGSRNGSFLRRDALR
jgi:hypothetical protein